MAHSSRLEALDRGINLRLSAHHEGPVHDQWLVDQGSRQNEKVGWVKSRKRHAAAITTEGDGGAARKRLSAAIRQNPHAPVNRVYDGVYLSGTAPLRGCLPFLRSGFRSAGLLSSAGLRKMP